MLESTLIIALLVTTPIILFPAALVWYLNIGGAVQAVREARQAKAAPEKKAVIMSVKAK